MENKKQTIIDEANKLIAEHGIINLTRKSLCEAAGIPNGSFSHYVGKTFTEFVKGLTDDIKPHKATTKRLSKDDRKNDLLQTALDLSVKVGYTNVSRGALATEAGVSNALVTHYFGTMKQLKRAIMRSAIGRSIPEIVAQGLAIGDDNARKAPVELKARAATALVNM